MKNKNFLFLDLETTSLQVKSAEIIEFCGCLTDDRGNIIRLESYINQDVVTNDAAQKINGISQELIEQGLPYEEFRKRIINLLEQADYLVAHNGLAYDFQILPSKVFLGDDLCCLSDKKILLDTYIHVDDGKKLAHQCLDHGVVLLNSHRAFNDVIALKDLFFKYDINEIIKYATAKKIIVEADVNIPNKDLAKTRGFMWNKIEWSPVCAGKWCKRILDYELDELRQSTSGLFEIIIL